MLMLLPLPGNIEVLNLMENNLMGSIPNELSSLRGALFLSGNPEMYVTTGLGLLSYLSCFSDLRYLAKTAWALRRWISVSLPSST